jgi:hypothetical protein
MRASLVITLLVSASAITTDTSAATCAEAYRNGHRGNGNIVLKNNLQVHCNFDDLDNIISTLKITSSNTGTLTGHESPCGKQYDGFSYNGNTAHMAAYVTAVKAAGGSCEQNFDFHCKGSGWTAAAYGSTYHCFGSDNQGKTNFGQDSSSTGTMLRTNNCKANDGNWRMDDGVVTDMDLLPVTKYWYGDTGHSSEDTRIVLKDLICTATAYIHDSDTTVKHCGEGYGHKGWRYNGPYVIKNNLKVDCDFSNTNAIKTTVSLFQSNTGNLPTGHESACGKLYDGFDYSETGSTQNIAQMVTDANTDGGSCEQIFDFHCKGSGYTAAAYGSKYHCFGSHNQDKTTFGQDSSSTGTMLRTNNCKANDASWRKDDGVVTDQDLLPVTKYWYGDTGSSSEDTRIVLKPLVCTTPGSTPNPTNYPTPNPTNYPTSAPTGILGHGTCALTWCKYESGHTIVNSKNSENWHCEKVGSGCKCVCDASLSCALRHHHTSGYKKTFEHC